MVFYNRSFLHTYRDTTCDYFLSLSIYLFVGLECLTMKIQQNIYYTIDHIEVKKKVCNHSHYIRLQYLRVFSHGFRYSHDRFKKEKREIEKKVQLVFNLYIHSKWIQTRTHSTFTIKVMCEYIFRWFYAHTNECNIRIYTNIQKYEYANAWSVSPEKIHCEKCEQWMELK